MKTLLLLATALTCAVASHAQTTPAPAASTTAPVSGTKNVGADRADAPQAPGMSTPSAQRAVPAARPRRSTNRPSPTTPAKAPAAPIK